MAMIEEEARQMAGSGTNINLVGAASGSGHSGHGCPEGIPVEIGLLSILAAFGVAFGVLYMALTLTTAARRKRSSDDLELESDNMCETDSVQELIGCGVRKIARGTEASVSFKFADLVWHGELGYSDCLGVSCLLS